MPALCLEESVDHEERVEDVARGQDKETQGKTQTTKGFLFPHHLKNKK